MSELQLRQQMYIQNNTMTGCVARRSIKTCGNQIDAIVFVVFTLGVRPKQQIYFYVLELIKFAGPSAQGVLDPQDEPHAFSLRSFSALLALAKSLGGAQTPCI